MHFAFLVCEKLGLRERERGREMKSSPPGSTDSSSSSTGSTRRRSVRPKTTKRVKARHDPANSPASAAPAPCSGSTGPRRSSVYRGVTRHRWTGRFEAHLWDKTTWNGVQNKKGRQVYLGAYDDEEAAARTYDLAALKYWGPTTVLNFTGPQALDGPSCLQFFEDLCMRYQVELEEMEKMSKEEYLASLRRRSSGFSRGVSKYRGVARHHHNGRWEARIGRVYGNKYLYLGTYNTQEEAAEAYDMAAIEYRGVNAVTNFHISNYVGRVRSVDPAPETPKSPDEEAQTPAGDSPENPPGGRHEHTVALPHHHHHQEDGPAEMELYDDDHHHHHLHYFHWLDTTTIPDVPLDRSADLPDLFSGHGFEENIDFIFEGPSSPESSVALGCRESTAGCGGGEAAHDGEFVLAV